MPLSLLTATADNIVLGPPLDCNNQEVELAVYPPMTNTIKLDQQPGRGEIVLLQMGQNIVRQTCVKRDDDILTPLQLKEHWPDIQKAMLKELQAWAKLEMI